MEDLSCRPGCAACCIAPSISSPIPGMPQGKPAGMSCIHLDGQFRCLLYGRPERPAVCRSLRPEPLMCGHSRQEAMAYLKALEEATSPLNHESAFMDPSHRR
ncbi:MAG TPA: YkgJ family cysteine cluster protein [Rectinemataceae bacterium]|nr:YkgJ family cysteine cluster protein [Rectinemataceae bacterium]